MLGLTLPQADWSETVQSSWWWDAPLFAGLAFRPTKNGGWKERALFFPGAPPLSALCDNPVFMPEGLDGHHDASAHVPHCHSQIMSPGLCARTHFPSTAHTHVFSFFFHKLFYIRHMSALLKIAWRVGGRSKKRRWLWEIKRRKQAIYFFV